MLHENSYKVSKEPVLVRVGLSRAISRLSITFDLKLLSVVEMENSLKDGQWLKQRDVFSDRH